MKSYRVPEIARKYVEHDMIRTYTELPEFPDSRTRLLYACLESGRNPVPWSELYALVVSLVQMGLDTHDLIDAGGDRPETEMRARQLKVLAGDYFSSRFYHLLSQAGQIEMIRKISDAVCEVNRLKMSLYSRMKQLKVTAEEYIGTCTELKSELFRLFGPLLEERIAGLWPELVRGFSRCEVVMTELERMEKTDGFAGSWGYWHIMQEGTREEIERLSQPHTDAAFERSLVAKYNIRSLLLDKLQTATASLQSIAGALDSDKLTEELARIGERFQRPFAGQPVAYNEMR